MAQMEIKNYFMLKVQARNSTNSSIGRIIKDHNETLYKSMDEAEECMATIVLSVISEDLLAYRYHVTRDDDGKYTAVRIYTNDDPDTCYVKIEALMRQMIMAD